jgi:hypothetical protein
VGADQRGSDHPRIRKFDLAGRSYNLFCWCKVSSSFPFGEIVIELRSLFRLDDAFCGLEDFKYSTPGRSSFNASTSRWLVVASQGLVSCIGFLDRCVDSCMTNKHPQPASDAVTVTERTRGGALPSCRRSHMACVKANRREQRGHLALKSGIRQARKHNRALGLMISGLTRVGKRVL